MNYLNKNHVILKENEQSICRQINLATHQLVTNQPINYTFALN